MSVVNICELPKLEVSLNYKMNDFSYRFYFLFAILLQIDN